MSSAVDEGGDLGCGGAGEITDISADEYKQDKKRRCRPDRRCEEKDWKNEYGDPLLAVEDEDMPNTPRTNLAGIKRSTRGNYQSALFCSE